MSDAALRDHLARSWPAAEAECSAGWLLRAAGFAMTARGEAVGLGVAEGTLCALFCVATRPECRRRGLAVAVVRALASFGIERGATRLVLEVAAANRATIRLYQRLGFTRRYAYAHRHAA